MSFSIDKCIYADNAATTGLDPSAFEAMQPFFTGCYGNASQPYSFSRSAREALREARRTIAESIGAAEDEIFFTSGGTESDNWAIKSVLASQDIESEVLVSKIEHHAVLNSAESLRSFGMHVDFLDVTNEGVVLPEVLQKSMKKETKLVSVMLANNEIGTIEPIKDLAKIAHEKGIIFHTDAVQAIGHIAVNVKDLGVDMLSASAHKFNGPKGIGFLYIHDGVQITPFMNGGAQEHGLRAGTENVASIVGMAIALKNNIEHIDSNTEYILGLEHSLVQQLNDSGLSFVRNGSPNHIPGNVSLSFKDSDGEMLLHRLDLRGICVSTGSACDSANAQVSHVIKAIGVDDEYSKGTIRISLGKYNSLDDVNVISSELIKILRRQL